GFSAYLIRRPCMSHYVVVKLYLCLLLLTQGHPTSPLFPYTTLFRSILASPGMADQHRGGRTYAERDHEDEAQKLERDGIGGDRGDRKSTRLNSSHVKISYAVFCLKKKNLIWDEQEM